MKISDSAILKEAAMIVRLAGVKCFDSDPEYYVKCLGIEQDLLGLAAARKNNRNIIEAGKLNLLVV